MCVCCDTACVWPLCLALLSLSLSLSRSISVSPLYFPITNHACPRISRSNPRSDKLRRVSPRLLLIPPASPHMRVFAAHVTVRSPSRTEASRPIVQGRDKNAAAPRERRRLSYRGPRCRPADRRPQWRRRGRGRGRAPRRPPCAPAPPPPPPRRPEGCARRAVEGRARARPHVARVCVEGCVSPGAEDIDDPVAVVGDEGGGRVARAAGHAGRAVAVPGGRTAAEG